MNMYTLLFILSLFIIFLSETITIITIIIVIIIIIINNNNNIVYVWYHVCVIWIMFSKNVTLFHITRDQNVIFVLFRTVDELHAS